MNSMVLDILRDTVTVTLFGLFVLLIATTWSPRRRKEFNDAANMIFDEGDRTADRAAPRSAGEKPR